MVTFRRYFSATSFCFISLLCSTASHLALAFTHGQALNPYPKHLEGITMNSNKPEPLDPYPKLLKPISIDSTEALDSYPELLKPISLKPVSIDSSEPLYRFPRALKPISIESITTVYDLLPQYGVSKGLLPDAVKSYSLSDNGDFEVELERSCYVQFDDLVYYDKKITGKLTYGSVSDVTGIQAKKLFLWVPVTGIEVDTASGLIEFHVGFLSEELPAEQFQTIPTCKSNAYRRTNALSSLIPVV